MEAGGPSPTIQAGPRHSSGNYRQISLTSVCCKLFETLLKVHLMSYLETNDILSEFEFGFRAGHSTEDQLLIFYDRIIGWVDSGFVVDVLYLDFSKAFDVVSHQILLEKLVCLGFDSLVLGWVREFLVGRVMSVSVSGVSSFPRNVLSGVPQGSVLGPLLFLVYANSIAADIGCSWTAFADDFKLCVCLPKPNDGNSSSQVLQDSLEIISERSKSWNMALNPTKCVAIRYGGRCSEERVPYTLDGVALDFVTQYRDLGVVVDERLRFHPHVDSVICKAGGLACNLLRSTKRRTRHFMLKLFVCYVRSIIDYCSSV